MECLLVYSLFKVGKGVLMKILFCLDGGDLERSGVERLYRYEEDKFLY